MADRTFHKLRNFTDEAVTSFIPSIFCEWSVFHHFTLFKLNDFDSCRYDCAFYRVYNIITFILCRSIIFTFRKVSLFIPGVFI